MLSPENASPISEPYSAAFLSQQQPCFHQATVGQPVGVKLESIGDAPSTYTSADQTSSTFLDISSFTGSSTSMVDTLSYHHDAHHHPVTFVSSHSLSPATNSAPDAYLSYAFSMWRMKGDTGSAFAPRF